MIHLLIFVRCIYKHRYLKMSVGDEPKLSWQKTDEWILMDGLRPRKALRQEMRPWPR